VRRYETIVIAHVDLSEDELSTLTTRYSGIITGRKGILVKIERWGKRKFAYLIKKQSRGFYILMDYAGSSDVVDELERNLKIDDKILKFMTIMKDGQIAREALEKEIQETQKKDEKKEGAVAAAPKAAEAAEAAADGASTPAQADAKGGNE
jgi:small subunit ribosomal protein S6